MDKMCNKCGQLKDIEDFGCYSLSKDGHNPVCKKCKSENQKRIRTQKKDGTYVSKCRKPRLTDDDRLRRKLELSQYHKEYRQRNKNEIRCNKRKYHQQIRLEGIAAYGGCCSCCGEPTLEFLTLEHINGRKNEVKRLTGYKAWAKLKREGWPKDNYTVLCFNCNCAKGIYGKCPHQK